MADVVREGDAVRVWVEEVSKLAHKHGAPPYLRLTTRGQPAGAARGCRTANAKPCLERIS